MKNLHKIAATYYGMLIAALVTSSSTTFIAMWTVKSEIGLCDTILKPVRPAAGPRPGFYLKGRGLKSKAEIYLFKKRLI